MVPYNYCPVNISQVAREYGYAGEDALAFEAGFLGNSSSGMPYWSGNDTWDYRIYSVNDLRVLAGRQARKTWEQKNPGKTFHR